MAITASASYPDEYADGTSEHQTGGGDDMDSEDERSGNEMSAETTMPDLLTQEETIRILRLDRLGLRGPQEALRHLSRTRQIGYVKVDGKVLIPRGEVLAYIERRRVEPLN